MAQLISIQERGETEGGWRAAVIFNGGPEYSVTVSDPFSKEEEQELEWYFEEHLEFPFTRKVRAKKAADSIAVYGEKLFNQVFGDRDIYDEYRDILKAGLNDLRIEIAGSPKFHALHWEALKDPKLQNQHPLATQAVIVRKNLRPQNLPIAVRPSPTINLLIVTARPGGQRDVGYRTITRPLVESLRSANLRVQVDILRPGTYRALENHLREVRKERGDGYYHVIHFDVHGAVFTYEQYQRVLQAKQAALPGNPYQFSTYARDAIAAYEGVKAFLSFELDAEKEDTGLVEASKLAALLVEHHVPITILNACQSGKQIGARETSLGSQLIREGVQLVLAMGYSVTVSAAKLLMSTLYQQLFAGSDLSIAIREGRAELYNNKERRAYYDQRIDLEDWLLPVVYQNQPVTLQPRAFSEEEQKAYNTRKLEEKRYAPPEPLYGFVGRDLDILQIEKRLLTKRNMLLIRGMGGAGKTTLLRHLRAWWHTTGFVQQTFYFGYDERAWTLQQILTEIGQQFYGNRYYTDVQPYPLAEQQIMIAERLRGANHLLILDNLESITGAHLAIQHTLPKEEQAALHSFLVDLAKGKTRVLLGSRSGEEWLARGTFDDNLYDLPGLDAEAASLLADRILERSNAIRYRTDEKEHENLRRLINLLDGFPLAMEVVLANLAKQTPQEILDALQEGDVKIDPHSSSQEKTASILRCIDYSHSNLSPEAQQLLLCLAPFTSVIDTKILSNYSEHLKQQPLLATLPFERWSAVIHEAQNWGLLSPDSNIPRFLHLQPTLAYFLRNRLNETGQVEVREAIETAFREHYGELGRMLFQLLQSKEPRERQIGQMLTGLEYENLVTALNLVLEAQLSISDLYNVLLDYLNTTKDIRRTLGFFQKVLERFQQYPSEKLSGPLGFEFVGVLGTVANRQFDLKQFSQAETTYHKILEVLEQLASLDKTKASGLKAHIYHWLGGIAEERRNWQQAEQYYQQALRIYIELNDHKWQAGTHHHLGIIAQQQKKWQQAEQYYQQALRIKIEFNDRYEQADTLGQLGNLAVEQQQWQQAEQYYQQTLQIFIEFNDRYNQAKVYHQLGALAQEQRQWQQAEQYYQHALQIKIEFNDRYSQAHTYLGLGAVAHNLQQWQQAGEYYLQGLQIYVEYKDNYSTDITLRNLALLWKASDDVSVRARIAEALEKSVEETEKMLLGMLEEGEKEQAGGEEEKG